MELVPRLVATTRSAVGIVEGKVRCHTAVSGAILHGRLKISTVSVIAWLQESRARDRLSALHMSEGRRGSAQETAFHDTPSSKDAAKPSAVIVQNLSYWAAQSMQARI